LNFDFSGLEDSSLSWTRHFEHKLAKRRHTKTVSIRCARESVLQLSLVFSSLDSKQLKFEIFQIQIGLLRLLQSHCARDLAGVRIY
jgi:hypothetical protein